MDKRHKVDKLKHEKFKWLFFRLELSRACLTVFAATVTFHFQIQKHAIE